MNDYNQEILKAQMEIKKENNTNLGMSDNEYLMNRKIIEKASKTILK